MRSRERDMRSSMLGFAGKMFPWRSIPEMRSRMVSGSRPSKRNFFAAPIASRRGLYGVGMTAINAGGARIGSIKARETRPLLPAFPPSDARRQFARAVRESHAHTRRLLDIPQL